VRGNRSAHFNENKTQKRHYDGYRALYNASQSCITSDKVMIDLFAG